MIGVIQQTHTNNRTACFRYPKKNKKNYVKGENSLALILPKIGMPDIIKRRCSPSIEYLVGV